MAKLERDYYDYSYSWGETSKKAIAKDEADKARRIAAAAESFHANKKYVRVALKAAGMNGEASRVTTKGAEVQTDAVVIAAMTVGDNEVSVMHMSPFSKAPAEFGPADYTVIDGKATIVSGVEFNDEITPETGSKEIRTSGSHQVRTGVSETVLFVRVRPIQATSSVAVAQR